MMVFIRWLIFIKTLKNKFLKRFSQKGKIQRIFNKKKGFLRIKRIQKSSHEKEKIQRFKRFSITRKDFYT